MDILLKILLKFQKYFKRMQGVAVKSTVLQKTCSAFPFWLAVSWSDKHILHELQQQGNVVEESGC